MILNIMRKSAGKWFIKLSLFIIVLVFTFWGVGNIKSKRLSNIAIVNGEPIFLDDYHKAYSNLLKQYQNEQSQDLKSVSEDIVDSFKKIALKNLINNKLLIQEATKIGISITDQEVINFIKENPIFYHEGTFNNLLYQNILSNVGLKPGQFETYNREFLLIKKLLGMLYGAINVSDLEMLNWYNWHNSIIDISYVFFNPRDYMYIDYDFEEIENYFKHNNQKYETNYKYRLSYVKFNPSKYLDSNKISDVDIKQYFDSHPEAFINEKTVNVSHILLKTNSDIEDEIIKVEERLKEIAKMATNGNNFTELAKLYSECPSKKNGGVLGDIKYTSVVEPFAKKAFSMLDGEVSPPIKTRFGWHIIKVNAVNEEKIMSFHEAKDTIKTILNKQSADNIAYNKAREFLETCFNEKNIIETAELFGADFEVIDWFIEKKEKLINELDKYSVEINSIISSMKLGQISDIFEFGGQYWIIQLIEKIDPKIPNLEEIKPKVIMDFKIYKSWLEANKIAVSFIKSIKNGKTFKNVAEENKFNIHSINFLKGNNYSYDYNNFKEEMFRKEFSTFKKGDITQKPIKGEDGYYVAFLNETIKPKSIYKLDNSENEIQNITTNLTNWKCSRFLSELLELLRMESEIKIKDEYL